MLDQSPSLKLLYYNRDPGKWSFFHSECKWWSTVNLITIIAGDFFLVAVPFSWLSSFICLFPCLFIAFLLIQRVAKARVSSYCRDSGGIYALVRSLYLSVSPETIAVLVADFSRLNAVFFCRTFFIWCCYPAVQCHCYRLLVFVKPITNWKRKVNNKKRVWFLRRILIGLWIVSCQYLQWGYVLSAAVLSYSVYLKYILKIYLQDLVP